MQDICFESQDRGMVWVGFHRFLGCFPPCWDSLLDFVGCPSEGQELGSIILSILSMFWDSVKDHLIPSLSSSPTPKAPLIPFLIPDLPVQNKSRLQFLYIHCTSPTKPCPRTLRTTPKKPGFCSSCWQINHKHTSSWNPRKSKILLQEINYKIITDLPGNLDFFPGMLPPSNFNNKTLISATMPWCSLLISFFHSLIKKKCWCCICS